MRKSEEGKLERRGSSGIWSVTGEIRDLVEAEESSDDEEHQLVPNLTTKNTKNGESDKYTERVEAAKKGEEEAAQEIHLR
jgi:hypothetical protein